MSLSGALTVALSGLQVSTTAAQIIAGNVSNAQTQGYTEKGVNLESVTTGSSLGGVEISGYSRVTNSVLTATLNNATSSASYLSTQNGYMDQVQSILDSTDDPPALSADLSNFQAAWSEYAANPSDTTLQSTVVSSGQALANEITSISEQTSTLQTDVQNDLSTTVSSLNKALANVQTLNTEITSALASNQSTADLEDQRDQAVNQISQYTSVSVMQRDNGQIALYTPGGVSLLDGQAQTFSVGSDGDSIVNASGADVTSALTGGSLQAQTDFLGTPTSANGTGVIAKLQSQMQNFANLFLAKTTNGGSFADAYDTADPNGFFTADVDPATGLADLSTFSVNSDLTSDASALPTETAASVNAVFSSTKSAITSVTDNPRDPANGTWTNTTGSTFQADGLKVQGQTFSGIATAILSGFQQAANAIKTQSTAATTQQTYYQNSLSSQTGVNTDSELVALTNWENSYAASAHVIATIQSMMTTLENMVST